MVLPQEDVGFFLRPGSAGREREAVEGLDVVLSLLPWPWELASPNSREDQEI